LVIFGVELIFIFFLFIQSMKLFGMELPPEADFVALGVIVIATAVRHFSYESHNKRFYEVYFWKLQESQD
jgi:hypothetical protein